MLTSSFSSMDRQEQYIKTLSNGIMDNEEDDSGGGGVDDSGEDSSIAGVERITN